MKTLLLDVVDWDLITDAAGNIALASEPYAYSQDVASAVKLFSGELFYDESKGVPYFEQNILGGAPPLSVLTAALQAAALTVPDVVDATPVIESFQNRTIGGSIRFRTSDGGTGSVNIQ